MTHAFTIFETMNDRGVNLSQTDMLKGYLLAHINYADAKLDACQEGRKRMKFMEAAHDENSLDARERQRRRRVL